MLMMTMTLSEVVRVIYLVALCRRSDVCWMVADLVRDLAGGRRYTGDWISPRGRVNRGEFQATRKASDYHPRLQ
jgi:hypothetical protein